jgi:hypothetical protein
MNLKQMEASVLKNRNISREDYDIAKNNIKRIVNLHGKAGVIAVVVIGCERGDMFDKINQEETKS